MKTTLAATVALALVLIGGGCLSPSKTAYLSIGATITMVDIAMISWAKHVENGAATEQQQQEIRNAYLDYQLAATTFRTAVIEAEGGDWEDVQKVDRALQDFETAATSLAALIYKLQEIRHD